jgi:hypothetical protein
VAIAALGGYLLRAAAALADDEAIVFGYGRRMHTARRWSYRAGGCFLLACGVATAVHAL